MMHQLSMLRTISCFFRLGLKNDAVRNYDIMALMKKNVKKPIKV